jgi:hypothetical protein
MDVKLAHNTRDFIDPFEAHVKNVCTRWEESTVHGSLRDGTDLGRTCIYFGKSYKGTGFF